MTNRLRDTFRAPSIGLILVVLAAAILGLARAGAAAQDATLVSKVHPSLIRDGAGGSLDSSAREGRLVSADGRYVVFTSDAPNVVAGQVSNLPRFPRTESQRSRTLNVFLHDRITGTTTLVSHVPGAPATAGNDNSQGAVISADGAFVAFESHATNLVAGTDVNNWPDVFVWERATGTVMLVSHAHGAPGTTGNGASASPVLSADGSVIAFGSNATDLVAGTDANGAGDIFVYERATATTSLVSHAVGAPGTAANGYSLNHVLSADGSAIAFTSTATSLVAGADGIGTGDVFLYERATGLVTLVSHVLGAPATGGNGVSDFALISANGAFVAFSSNATDLTAATYETGAANVFLWERATGTVTLLSHYVGQPDLAGHNDSRLIVMNASASVVIFNTNSGLFDPPGRMSPGDQDDPPEGPAAGTVLYDRATGTLTAFPRIEPGASISADGSRIATVRLEPAAGEFFPHVSGVLVHDRTTGTSRRVDHVPGDPNTAEPGMSWAPVLSEGGGVVVFVHRPPTASRAFEDPGVGPAPPTDVYLYDLAMSTRTLVSRRDPARPSLSGGAGSAPRGISADGRWVVFVSHAPDLVAGQVDVNRSTDVFLHDRATGTTTLVSHVPGDLTTTGFGFAADPVMSADGAFVAFRQHTHWRGDDGEDHVYLYERATGALTLVSQALGEPGTPENPGSRQPAISADGAWVAFTGRGGVYLYERATGALTLVGHKLGAPGTPANAGSHSPAINADGSVVAFVSRSTDLVAGTDTNGASDVFVYRRATGTVTLVSHVPGLAGVAGNGASESPVVSADDAFIAFRSDATNLVAGADLNGKSDVFLYARATGTVVLVSHVSGVPGTTGNGASSSPLISADGSAVVFLSDATNLVPGTDTNGARDVFLYDRAAAAVTLVSHVPGAPATTGNALSREPAISADGTIVAFESDATDLVAGTDTNEQRLRHDVFLYDRATGGVTLVSHARGASDTTGDTISYDPIISADGTVVVFASLATNLVDNDFNATNLVANDAVNGYFDVFAYVYERADPPPPTPDGPDLVEAAVGDPPAALSPGARFSVTDTVRNQGNAGAGASTTRYYLSVVRRRTPDSMLLGGRAVPGLTVGASSQGSVSVRLPMATAEGTYYVVACADDLGRVGEGRESNNCTASASPVRAGRADLLVTALTDPPASATRGIAFAVTDTVQNRGVLTADPSTTRYYLSLNAEWGTADRRLTATRTVPALAAGASFAPPAPLTLTIPTNMPAGTYHLLACTDDLRRVMEDDEKNNCTASAGRVTVP